MNKYEAIKDSIKHWRKMIRWAKKQRPDGENSTEKMCKDLGEVWFRGDCSLCKKYLKVDDCPKCPLNKKHGKCGHAIGGNLWLDIFYSRTWGEWLENAKPFLKQLESLIARKVTNE